MMQFPSAPEGAVVLTPPRHGQNGEYNGAYIAGMALIENDDGQQKIEWVVWDYDRNIYVTDGFYAGEYPVELTI